MRSLPLLALLLLVPAVWAQAPSPRVVLFGEAGGASFFGVSSNVEYFPTAAFGVRGGVGYLPAFGSGSGSPTASVAAVAVLGTSADRLDVSVGALRAWHHTGTFQEGLAGPWTPYLQLGLRYYAQSGSVFRLTLTGFLDEEEGRLVLPWPGIGYGLRL